MTFTRDGMVHYYAKPGVGKLTPADLLGLDHSLRNTRRKLQHDLLQHREPGRRPVLVDGMIVDDPEIYVLY